MSHVLLAISLTSWPAMGQVARITNISYPVTALEVGDAVEVSITGATPGGTVSSLTNGFSYTWPTAVDGSGNWSVTATEATGNVGSYVEHWYVNGSEVTYASYNGYLPNAPYLPAFDVYANTTSTNCPTQSTASAYCGSTLSSPRHWIWSPVTYYNDSATYATSVFTSAANGWNSNESVLGFSNDTSTRFDSVFYDSTSIGGINAVTYVYGGDCSTDVNTTDSCNGACFNAQSSWYAYIFLNPSNIAGAASALGISASTFASVVATHELGHVARLTDATATNGTCSEAQGIMYSSGSVLWGCGITHPTSCDAGGLNTVYPTAVQYCSPDVYITTSGTCL